MRYTIHTDIIWKDQRGSVSIWQLATRGQYYLRGSAADIWRYLQKPRSAKELAAMVTEAYEVDFETAHTDVSKFLNDMLARECLSRSNS